MKQLLWWQRLTAAPHRLLFLGGAAQLVMITAWWSYDLLARYVGGLPYRPPAIAPVAGHMLLMINGFMPLFIFGFLFTAGPRWLGVGAPGKKQYVPLCLLLALAALGMDAGVWLGRMLLAGATLLMLLAWAWAARLALGMLRRSQAADQYHARVVIAGICLGWGGLAFDLAWLLGDRPAYLAVARTVGIWLFLLPVFVSVCHRMIPFFSNKILSPGQAAWRPYGLLWCLLAGGFIHAVLDITGRQAWLWSIDLPMALAVLLMVVRWHFLRSFQERLLAMLHMAFAWLGVGQGLYALQSLGMAFLSDHTMLFGLAPLHALTLGYFTSMLLAMASRVSLGHAGQQLAASPLIWRIFLFFQLVTVLRVLPDLLGNVPPGGFYVGAALLAFACFATWALKFVPVYLRPRIDGRPG